MKVKDSLHTGGVDPVFLMHTCVYDDCHLLPEITSVTFETETCKDCVLGSAVNAG